MTETGTVSYGEGGLSAIAYAPTGYVGAVLKEYPRSLFQLDNHGHVWPVRIPGSWVDGQIVSAVSGIAIAFLLYVVWLSLHRLFRKVVNR